MKKYVIWSEEHKAWWRPNSCGYTDSIRNAGLYAKAQAEKIVANANCYGRRFNEIAFAVDDNFVAAMDRPTER